MAQNQNRPPRDTPAQQMGKGFPERPDPLGQDKALRATEMFAQDMMNGADDDEGPPPGSDLYYELLERAGVSPEALEQAFLKYRFDNEDADDEETERAIFRELTHPDARDDEFYGGNFSTNRVEDQNKVEPWVIKNTNAIADRDAEAGIPHRGYDVEIATPVNSGGRFDKETRYLSAGPQEDEQVDPRYRWILERVLGKPQGQQ